VGWQKYINETRNLIRDPQGLFVPTNTLTGYINDARHETSLLTDCCRRLITGQSPFGATAVPGSAVPGGAMPGSTSASTFNTIAGQERYPFIGFGNIYLNQQYQGLRGIRDVISVSVSWGGTSRPSLDWMPWEDLQAYLRSNQILVTNYPSVFSIYNDGEAGEVYLYSTPQTANEMEWDVFCTAGDIFSDDDYDAIPDPFTSGVKFYAAGRAFEDSGRYDSASLMFARFEHSNGLRRGAVDRGKTKSFYPVWR
jgi:hypothetical protein